MTLKIHHFANRSWLSSIDLAMFVYAADWPEGCDG